MNPYPLYLVVYRGMIVNSFDNPVDMDEFSKKETDGNFRIYRLGTDLLIDGHTEGYMNKIRRKN